MITGTEITLNGVRILPFGLNSWIKNFQMANNIFLKPNKREVAYQSIGWDLDKCLPGFYENLVKGYLPASVTSAHELPEAWVKEPAKYKEDILKYMDARCHVAEIVARGLDATQLAGIRNIGTNLTPIKEGLVKDMITHAENTTELQVRLYCPSIL